MCARPSSALTDAIDLARGGRLQAAVSACHESLVMDDTQPVAHALFAHLMNECGCYEEAIRSATRAIELGHDCLPAYLALGSAYDRVGGASDQALLVWHELAELLPDSPEVALQLGQAYATVGMEEDAQACRARALDLDPHVRRAHYDGALEALRSAGAASALPFLHRAADEDPATDELFFRLAAEAAATSCGSADAAEMRIAVLDSLRHEQYLDALRAASSALARDPSDAIALSIAAFCYSKQAAVHEALGCALRALEIEPDCAVTLYVLGTALSRWPGLTRRSARVFASLVRNAPEHALAHVLLASALLPLQRYEHAERALRTAVRLDPTSVRTRYTLAFVRQVEGAYSEAQWEARRASALDLAQSGLMWRLLGAAPEGGDAS